MIRVNFRAKKPVLKKILDIYNKFVDDIYFECTKTGIKIITVDPAHVCILDSFIPDCSFEEYDYNYDFELIWGMEIKKLLAVLKSVKDKDILDFEYDKDRQKLIIKYRYITHTKNCIDPEQYVKPSMKRVEYKTKCIINNSDALDVLKSMRKVSDEVILNSSDGNFSILSGDDDKTVNSKIPVEIITNADSITSYSFDYLCKFIGKLSKKDSVVVEYSSNSVLKITYENSLFGIKFYLAPREFDADRVESVQHKPGPEDKDKPMTPRPEISEVKPEIAPEPEISPEIKTDPDVINEIQEIEYLEEIEQNTPPMTLSNSSDAQNTHPEDIQNSDKIKKDIKTIIDANKYDNKISTKDNVVDQVNEVFRHDKNNVKKVFDSLAEDKDQIIKEIQSVRHAYRFKNFDNDTLIKKVHECFSRDINVITEVYNSIGV